MIVFIYIEVTAFTDVVVPITKRKDSGNKQQVIESKEGMRECDLKTVMSMIALAKDTFCFNAKYS